MKTNRMAAIIIAAGYSSRMNRFKPLLRFQNGTAVERLIDTYRCCGIQNIYVVVGHNSEDILEILKDLQVTVVWNEAYAEGMFMSVKKGILALNEDVDAFFMQPADIPLVKVHTIEQLKEKYFECEKGILYPAFRGEKGHPPLISCKYNSMILSSKEEGGLKGILETLHDDSVIVPVFDKAILMDMDKKEDYESLLAYDSRKAPDREECLAIMEKYMVSAPIIRHCEAVEGAARSIYQELNSCGIQVEDSVLFAAALLHDIARQEKNHALVGADIIRAIGYPFVGDVIASHMDIKVCEEEPVTEQEILYLADKLVIEDEICRMDERFEQALRDKGNNPMAVQKIKERWLSAKAIMKKIERITGKVFPYGL